MSKLNFMFFDVTNHFEIILHKNWKKYAYMCEWICACVNMKSKFTFRRHLFKNVCTDSYNTLFIRLWLLTR